MTAVRFCPSCGAARIEGARFCGSCGADLEALGGPRVPVAPGAQPQTPLVAQVPASPPPVPRPTAVATTPVAGRSTPGDSRPARDEPPTRRRRSLVLVGLVVFLVIAAGVGVGTVLLLRPSSAPCAVAGSPFPSPVALNSPSAGLGVCLQVVYQVLPVGDRQPDAGVLSTTKLILENRLRAIGVADAIVETFGTDRVVVILPSRGDLDSIRALLVQTGQLDFVPLPPAEYGTQSAAGTYQAVDGQPLPTTEPRLFGGEEIDQAYPSTDSTGGRAVGFRLRSAASRLFGDYTSKHVGEFFAIVLDGKVVSAPVIQSAITGGSGIISGGSAGGFSANEMDSLITVLNYGSLPFPLKEESFQPVAAPVSASTAP